MVGIVPGLEAGYEAAHDVLEAMGQGAIAHQLGGGEVKIHHHALAVPYGGARGDHEVVVSHIDLIIQVAVQDLHVPIGIGLHLVILGQAVVVDPVDHVEFRIRQGGDTDVVDFDRHGNGQSLLPHTDGQIAFKDTHGSIGGHVDADVEGGSPRLGLPLVDGTGDLVDLEGSFAGDEVLDRLVIGGAEHFGVAVQGDGGGQKLVDNGLTALHGEIGGDGLALGKDMVGQHLKTDVGATGSVKLGLIGGYDLTVGIYPLVFGKDLILHRLVPF